MTYHNHNKRRDFDNSVTRNSLIVPQISRHTRVSQNEGKYSDFQSKYSPLIDYEKPSSKSIGPRESRIKVAARNTSQQRREKTEQMLGKNNRVRSGLPTWLNKISSNVEGRKSIRAITFFGGVASTITSVIAVSHVQKLILTPPVAILLIYQLFFGVATVIIEAKDFKMLESIQPWISEWFPFLSQPLGKGFLYILMGVLGLSIWQHFLYVAAAGGFMCFIGGSYLVISCGGHTSLQQHVGIELTQHPARGGYGNIPQLGYHRQRYADPTSHTNSPRFGPQQRQGGYYSINEYETMDPMLTGTEVLEEETTTGLHSEWSKSDELPHEFVNGMRQFQQEQTFQRLCSFYE